MVSVLPLSNSRGRRSCPCPVQPCDPPRLSLKRIYAVKTTVGFPSDPLWGSPISLKAAVDWCTIFETFLELVTLSMDPVRRLPGMRDLSASDYQELRSAADILGGHFTSRGYDQIDTPMLEETDLFVRKSGGALTGWLCTFTDSRGRRVSLRPEFTSSVIRHFIDEGESVTLPARWQYSGPVFRYDTDDGGDVRQFHQVGAELIGAAGADGDAEVIRLALAALDEVGLSKSKVQVGHIGVLHDLLAGQGLSKAAVGYVISNVEGIKAGQTTQPVF